MVAHTHKNHSLRKNGDRTKKNRSHGKHNTQRRKIARRVTKRHGGVNSDSENENENENSNRNSGYNNYSSVFNQNILLRPVSPLSPNDKRWLRIADKFLTSSVPRDVPERFFVNVMSNASMHEKAYEYIVWRLETFAKKNHLYYTHQGRKRLYNLNEVFNYIQRKYSQMQRRMNIKLLETYARLRKHIDAEWAMLVNERRDQLEGEEDMLQNDVRNNRPFPPHRKQYDTYITRHYKPIENAMYQDHVYTNNSNSNSNNTNND